MQVSEVIGEGTFLFLKTSLSSLLIYYPLIKINVTLRMLLLLLPQQQQQRKKKANGW